jgi:hypothetical protein
MSKTPDKPALTIVDPATIGPLPPRQLGRHGSELWRTVMADYQIEDRGGIELLTQAAQAVDRLEALAERINQDGEIIIVRGIPKPHPALREELSTRSFVCRTLERLGLNLEAIRPTGGQPKRRKGYGD